MVRFSIGKMFWNLQVGRNKRIKIKQKLNFIILSIDGKSPLWNKVLMRSVMQFSVSATFCICLPYTNHLTLKQKEDVEKLAGYLSLHQGPEGLSVKWTPNQLMNGCSEDGEEDIDRR